MKIARIYCIVCSINESIKYIGSTTLSLHNRMWHHKHAYEKWIASGKTKKLHTASIFSYFEEYGVDNFSIELLEEFTIDDQLVAREKKIREQVWINKTECVNQVRAFVTEEERQRSLKEYRESISDKMKVYKRNWYEKNKDSEKYKQRQEEYIEEKKEYFKETRKKWYEENKEIISQKKKKYRNDHREEMLEREKLKYQRNKTLIRCETCNTDLIQYNLKLHLKTAKHQHYLEHPDVPYKPRRWRSKN